MLTCCQHRTTWTLVHAVWVDDSAIVSVPLEAGEMFATYGCEPIAAAGRLTLVLGRTSLSAAGLVMSVRYIVALSAAGAIGLYHVRQTEDDRSSVQNALRMR